MERMNIRANTATLISALETSPGVIIPLVREVPQEILKRRPAPQTWSAYENACHLTQSDKLVRDRLALILSSPAPYIKSAEPTPEEQAGSLLDVDLDESLERYARERATLVERIKQLTPDEWKKTAEHEAFAHYSVFIMFRHLFVHEMLHAYRIEQLMLKKDWD